MRLGILAVQSLNRVLHGSRQLAIGAAKLLQQHVSKTGVWIPHVDRVHQLLDVVIHGELPTMSERGMAAIERAGRKACSKPQRGEQRDGASKSILRATFHPIPLIRQGICRCGVGGKVTFPGAKLRFDSLIKQTHEPPEGACKPGFRVTK